MIYGRLISVLDGDAKRAAAIVGHSGLDFGNPLVVSYKKVKAVLDQPQIQPNDKTSLRRYHQGLRSTVLWLKSMGKTPQFILLETLQKLLCDSRGL